MPVREPDKGLDRGLAGEQVAAPEAVVEVVAMVLALEAIAFVHLAVKSLPMLRASLALNRNVRNAAAL